MFKRRMVVVAIVFSLICNFLGVNLSGAWFVSGGVLGGADYVSAKVNYLPTLTPTETEQSIYGKIIDGSTDQQTTFLIPGDQIIVKPEQLPNMCLSLENFSTVATNLRVKIDIEFIETQIENMYWKKVADNTYQYGKNTDIYSDGQLVESNVFMGLLEVTFAQGKVKDTVIPNDVAPTTAFGENSYKYVMINDSPPSDTNQISFENAWEFVFNDSKDIPAVNNVDRQFYNTISSIKVVGDSLNSKYQNAFNDFFSGNYAGQQIRLTVAYYAKQNSEYMPWTQFTKTVLEAITPI